MSDGRSWTYEQEQKVDLNKSAVKMTYYAVNFNRGYNNAIREVESNYRLEDYIYATEYRDGDQWFSTYKKALKFILQTQNEQLMEAQSEVKALKALIKITKVNLKGD